ncbi:acyl-CoA thioesterase [Denitromonas sp. IR12]|uniref:Acyl-CoA thioesterase n=2 Tax=Denitromonas iodatirespirans TaxID=2795389 RepID=A0A944H861_DENI1|nr:acyl-CoA thioesterase [Denitromonas iodatirespirans]
MADSPDITRIAEIVFPGHTNHDGILHGGPALSWLAKAALVAASRRARRALVMASSEKLDFVAPARSGDIAEISARVERVGRSSLTVATELHAESPLSGERRLCTRAGFVFVAVDTAGRSTPIDSAVAR